MKTFLIVISLVVQIALQFTVVLAVKNENTIAWEIEKPVSFLSQTRNVNASGSSSLKENGIQTLEDCGFIEGGTGYPPITDLKIVHACSFDNCPMGTRINVWLSFALPKAQSNLNMSISLLPKKPAYNPTKLLKSIVLDNPYFHPHKSYESQISVVLSYEDFNKYPGQYDFQIKLINPTTNKNAYCNTSPITLVLPPNSGTALNDKCSVANQPCFFKNSRCESNDDDDLKLTCQCDWDSFNERNQTCKTIVGKFCEQPNDCISNSGCKMEYANSNYGICRCNQNYTNINGNLGICAIDGGSGSIVFSMLVLVNLQLLAAIFK